MNFTLFVRNGVKETKKVDSSCEGKNYVLSKNAKNDITSFLAVKFLKST